MNKNSSPIQKKVSFVSYEEIKEQAIDELVNNGINMDEMSASFKNKSKYLVTEKKKTEKFPPQNMRQKFLFNSANKLKSGDDLRFKCKKQKTGEFKFLKSNQKLLESMKKLSENSMSEYSGQPTIISARRILEKINSSNKVLKTEDLLNDLKQIQSTDMKKHMAMFSCKITKREIDGELKVSFLKKIKIVSKTDSKSINNDKIEETKLEDVLTPSRNGEQEFKCIDSESNSNEEMSHSKQSSSPDQILSESPSKENSSSEQIKEKSGIVHELINSPLSLDDSGSESQHSTMSMIISSQQVSTQPIQQSRNLIPGFFARFRQQLSDDSTSINGFVHPPQHEIDSDEPQAPQNNRLRNFNMNNPFGRHIIIVNDIESQNDQARFLHGLTQLSQEDTNAGSNYMENELSPNVQSRMSSITESCNEEIQTFDEPKEIGASGFGGTFAFRTEKLIQSQGIKSVKSQSQFPDFTQTIEERLKEESESDSDSGSEDSLSLDSVNLEADSPKLKKINKDIKAKRSLIDKSQFEYSSEIHKEEEKSDFNELPLENDMKVQGNDHEKFLEWGRNIVKEPVVLKLKQTCMTAPKFQEPRSMKTSSKDLKSILKHQ